MQNRTAWTETKVLSTPDAVPVKPDETYGLYARGDLITFVTSEGYPYYGRVKSVADDGTLNVKIGMK